MDSTDKTRSADQARKAPDLPEGGRIGEHNAEKVSEGMVKLRKQDMIGQLRALSAKLGAANTREELLPVGSDVERMLGQIEKTKTEAIESETRKLGIASLESLNNALYSNLRRLSKNADFLGIVIKFGTRALSFLPEGYAQIAGWYSNLGRVYYFRYDVDKTSDDLDASINYLSESLKTSPPNDPKIAERVDSLGKAYLEKCRRSPRRDAVIASIDDFSSTILLKVQGETTIPSVLNSVGNLYLHRASLNKRHELQDIDKAKEYYTRAAHLAQGSKEHPLYLHNVGSSFHSRFKRSGQIEDINAAIDTQTKALEITPSTDSNLISHLTTLGDTYQTRFSSFGKVEDLNDAIQHHERALSLSPEGSFHRPSCLSSLGDSYMERFVHFGGAENIKKAIDCQAKAISLTYWGDPDLIGRLNNIGLSYRSRFNHYGSLDDIDTAIEQQERATRLAMKLGRDSSYLFFNLGDSYQIRYSRLRRKPDLESAIHYQVRAVSLTPDDHPIKPNQLDSLGRLLAHRFSLWTSLSNLDDINEAIDCQTLAIQLASQKHTKFRAFLNNLGTSYKTRFIHDDPGNREDIDEAINLTNQAVDLTPDEHYDKPRWLASLGNAYSERFNYFRDFQDLDRAIKAQTRAISLASDGHPIKAELFMGLAVAWLRQYEQSENRQALDDSIKYLQMVVEYEGGHSNLKFNAARLRASLLSSNHYPGVIEAYRIAVACLDRVIWLGDLTATTYYHIFQTNDFFSEAAATAIHEKEYYLALEWIEAGRSIVWRQLLQLKAPVDDLASINPKLAKELNEVRDELYDTISEISTSSADPSQPLMQSQNYYVGAVPNHHRLVYRYDALMDQVREIPGFENFMRPKTGLELAQCAKSGPVVVVTTHQSRCDALVLLPNQNEIKHVPLPNMFRHPALKLHVHSRGNNLHTWNVGELEGYRGIRLEAGPDQYEIMLDDLWQCLAKPILEALGYLKTSPPPVDDLPHITWSIAGPLSFLPLHAAGDYSKPHARLFNFAISSYTPMLGVLLRPQAPPRNHSRILAIGQEETPGQVPLPCTKEELSLIDAHAKAPIEFLQLDGYKATSAAVKSAMQEYDWVHLACHATQISYDPMASAFWLYESQLELRQIIQSPLKNKGLAFLSACHTAAGEAPLPNESAHLASGMLVAGYSSVIATMWTIFDKDAPLVANKVYAQLIKDGQLDYTQSAMALHKATSELREKVGEKEFVRWAPFIHMGS